MVLPLQNPRSCNKSQGFTQHCQCEGLHGNFSGFCTSALKTKLISSKAGSRSHTWILSKRRGQQPGCAGISSPHITGQWDLPWAAAAISAARSPPHFFPHFPLFFPCLHEAELHKCTNTNTVSLQTLDRGVKIVATLPGKFPHGQHWMLDLLDGHRQRPGDCPPAPHSSALCHHLQLCPFGTSSECLYFGSAVAPSGLVALWDGF